MNKRINIVVIQKKFKLNHGCVSDQVVNHIEKSKIKKSSIVVLHELVLSRYFPITKLSKYDHYVTDINDLDIEKIQSICKKLSIFLVLPIFENGYKNENYNTALVIDDKGMIIGKQRKVSIPNENCYFEKHYFTPSSSFKVFKIRNVKIGVLICWDQWFPENYKKLYNLGADIIISPTAIGHAYKKSKLISLRNEKKKWEMVIKTNSLLINTPVIVANRCDIEKRGENVLKFWGSSFVTNSDGDIIERANKNNMILSVSINTDNKRKSVKKWGFLTK